MTSDRSSAEDTPAGRRTPTRPTIADVARLSGFSAMTVSRVINDGPITAKTRAAVLNAIAQLGYAPNQAARALAGSGPTRIGLPYSNPSAAYLSEFLLGALDQAQTGHGQLIVVKCDLGSQYVDVVRSLLASGVDGILLPPPLCDSTALLALIADFQVPVVAVAGAADAGDVATVRIDDFAAARAMMRHILELGHRRIGFIGGSADQATTLQRREGYCAALAEARIAEDPALIVPGDFTYRSGLSAAARLLDLPDRPTAIFASNDDMAAAAVATAHQRQLDVPTDLTVCGFDDTLFAQSIWPELTTIHQPIGEMARVAVAMLLAAIRSVRRGDQDPPARTVLDHALVRRASDGPPCT